MSGERLELVRRAQAGEQEAAQRLVEENTGLIWSVARRFFGRGRNEGFVRAAALCISLLCIRTGELLPQLISGDRFMMRRRSMSKQNIYDNDAFFENFQSSRSSDVNFNDCIETPILFSMLPDLHGKKILDIGCGMGQHARQYSDMGAASVLGIDLSAKMLEYAKEHNSGGNILYRQMAMEDIDTISETFDLVTSSLVFDYAESVRITSWCNRRSLCRSFFQAGRRGPSSSEAGSDDTCCPGSRNRGRS